MALVLFAVSVRRPSTLSGGLGGDRMTASRGRRASLWSPPFLNAVPTISSLGNQNEGGRGKRRGRGNAFMVLNIVSSFTRTENLMLVSSFIFKGMESSELFQAAEGPRGRMDGLGHCSVCDRSVLGPCRILSFAPEFFLPLILYFCVD